MRPARYTNATSRLFLLAGAALLLLLPAREATAQSDFTHVMDFPYTPSNCSAEPAYDRVFRIQRLAWKGHEYLFADEGNELRIFNIDSPLSPTMGPGSFFNLPVVGDQDYKLVNFSVCDDCRWGWGNDLGARVIFDLGTGATPTFSSFTSYDDTVYHGGFTFAHGGQQYLVAADIGVTNCTPHSSGLYELNSEDMASNPLVHCLDAGGTAPQISNGLVVPDSPTPTVYLAERFGQFHIFSMQTTPDFHLQYEGNGGIERARMGRAYAAAVDSDAGLLAVAASGSSTTPGTVSLYDIGWANGTPKTPVHLHTHELTDLMYANTVGLRYPIVWVATTHTTTPPQTFDVSDPTDFVSLDQSFWDVSHPWNSLSTCLWNEMAVFSADGAAMYLSRYASLQVIDVSGIQPPACGDGLVEVLEGCDDGNTADGDGCSAACQQEAGWVCAGEPSVCDALTSCGDGQLQTPEICDDGNTIDGDGCSASCSPESGWSCSGEPSVCVPTAPCGDGIMDPGQECDDGNQTAGDGCSELCQVESGWTCVGQPSVCEEEEPSGNGSSSGCGCAQSTPAPIGAIVVFGLWLLGLRRRRSARAE